MNKNAIKKYAVWARNELITKVIQRAYDHEITRDKPADLNADIIAGRPLASTEKEQRRNLISRINTKGFDPVMEEVAYTWFNRFIALRFMEVNEYLPSRVRVFTNETGAFAPGIMTEALTLDLAGLNREKVIAYLEEGNSEALYKYLLLTQCNALHSALPDMFQPIANETELLFPSNLLKPDSVVARLVSDIPEEDWKEAVEIIGWLYQFYNDERKNQVINIYKGTVKKEDIPAATQLFTTDWVVRYMVDNSLGRYWLERNPNSRIREKLDFFVEPADGLQQISERVKPEDLTFFDPCMGSGHILVYAFEVLMAIYSESGYSERDAAVSIVENNLFGLDIDDRAGQLAYFAVIMKARSHHRRFLTLGISPHVYAIQESNGMAEFKGSFSRGLAPEQEKIGEYLANTFQHAKEIGSLQRLENKDYQAFIHTLEKHIDNLPNEMLTTQWIEGAAKPAIKLAQQADLLSRKYAVVATNPPYMNKLEGNLKRFITENYKDYSGDLFSAFIYRNFDFCQLRGYSAFMAPFVWMFIKTYEKLRSYIVGQKSITGLVQMEYSAFEEATVPICTFVLKNSHDDVIGQYIRLTEFRGGMEVQKLKVLEAINNPDCDYLYNTNVENFKKIPGMPIAYWVGDRAFYIFANNNVIENHAKTRAGMITGNNAIFVRLWYEVSYKKFGRMMSSRDEAIRSKMKWFPYNKGGEYRKWYGNNEYVVNWENDGFLMRNHKNSSEKIPAHAFNLEYIFRENVTWNSLSSYKFSARYTRQGFLFDASGSFADIHKLNIYYTLAFLCSEVAFFFLSAINPTLNFQKGNISVLPFIIDDSNKARVDYLSEESVSLSVNDWDSFETSWDFKKHPLV